MYYLLIAGLVLLTAILALFWLKDQVQSPTLARIAHSGLVARLALAAAAFAVLGLLLILGRLVSG